MRVKRKEQEKVRAREKIHHTPRVVDLIIIIIINRLKDVLSLFQTSRIVRTPRPQKASSLPSRPGLSNTPETSRRLLRVTASPGLSLFRSRGVFPRLSSARLETPPDLSPCRRRSVRTACSAHRLPIATEKHHHHHHSPPAELVVVFFGWLKSSSLVASKNNKSFGQSSSVVVSVTLLFFSTPIKILSLSFDLENQICVLTYRSPEDEETSDRLTLTQSRKERRGRRNVFVREEEGQRIDTNRKRRRRWSLLLPNN